MSYSRPFISPRLVGQRFEEHSIPLEVLKDLAVLEEMIIEVAKWCYLEDHPDRRRSPRGFTDGVSLKLASIEEGSAITNIVLSVSIAASIHNISIDQPNTDYTSYFERARESIINTISAADKDNSSSKYSLPNSLLGYFDRLGRSLQDGEAIEFHSKDSNQSARLDRNTRHKLVTASQVRTYTDEVSFLGTVPEADQMEMTFQLQLEEGKKLKAPIHPQHFESVMQAFNGYSNGFYVQVEGIGRFNRSGKVIEIETVEQLAVVDEFQIYDDFQIGYRLRELLNLKDGWLDGKGKALDRERLSSLNATFAQLYDSNLPIPSLYPTPEGGILAEWLFKPYDISLEIDLETFSGHWHSLNLLTDEEEERALDLNSEIDWDWIMRQIRELQHTA